MKNLFKGYYQLDEDERNTLWDNATIIFDTNVLLNFYRYKPSTREELFKIIGEYTDRVWLPYHTGLEFHRNRLTVISEQDKKYPQFKKIFDEAINKIDGDITTLSQKYKHSFFNSETLVNDIRNCKDNFFKELGSKEEENSSGNATHDDDILAKVNDLFLGKIGDPPESQAIIDSICAEGEDRYEKEIPPGYEDARKGENSEELFHYGGIEYKPKFGDLILWKQIIQYVKDSSLKDVIFVTDDNKTDWWWTLNGKRIGARPELVDEIMRESEVERFHLYNTASFLKFAGSRDQAVQNEGVSIESAIEDVRNVNLHLRSVDVPPRIDVSPRHSYRRVMGSAVKVVAKYFSYLYEGIEINDRSFPDIVGHTDGEKTAIEVFYLRNFQHGLFRLKELLLRGYYEISENGYKEFILVVVVPSHVITSHDVIDRIIERTQRILEEHNGRASIIFAKGVSYDESREIVEIHPIKELTSSHQSSFF